MQNAAFNTTRSAGSCSHGITTGWSASVSAGFAFSALKIFGADVKVTLTQQLQQTLTRSKSITYTTTYSGSWDRDYIVFQGTLYHLYEYEIISSSDPKAVGQKMTINDPVATKIYKWPVEDFNTAMPKVSRIGKDVLSHTIGNPASYATHAQAVKRLTLNEGWMDKTGKTVGRGSSTIGSEIALTKSRSSEKSRTYSVGVEANFNAGGGTRGVAFGINKGWIYSVTIAEGTAYSGTVGDIGSNDWARNQYEFGLLVYKDGVDSQGKTQKGKRPFHVVNYWTK